MNELKMNGKKYKLVEITDNPTIELIETIDGIQRQAVHFKTIDDVMKFFKRKNPFAITNFEAMDELTIKLRWLKNK